MAQHTENCHRCGFRPDAGGCSESCAVGVICNNAPQPTRNPKSLFECYISPDGKCPYGVCEFPARVDPQEHFDAKCLSCRWNRFPCIVCGKTLFPGECCEYGPACSESCAYAITVRDRLPTCPHKHIVYVREDGLSRKCSGRRCNLKSRCDVCGRRARWSFTARKWTYCCKK